jgi:hypothetical protein
MVEERNGTKRLKASDSLATDDSISLQEPPRNQGNLKAKNQAHV